MASHSKRQRLQTPALTHTSSLDQLLQSALSLPDPSLPIALSLDRILDATPLQSDKTLLLSSATRFASALLDAANRSTRKLAAVHNSTAWPLTADLTIKVFSMLDSESVCVAAAACSLFRRCASDSLCYENIDVTRSVGKVTNSVVSTMIQRAGKNLRSIKLGRLPQNIDRLDEDESPLTESCLAALTLDGGAAGLLLQKLHLYNIKMNDCHICSALPTCKSLSELEFVGIDIWCYETILKTVMDHCHSIKHLCFDVRGINNRHGIVDVPKTCHRLSSLSLRGFEILDSTLSVLIKSACGLRYLDLLGSLSFAGRFLSDLSDGFTNTLETLILCDCWTLRADEVSFFLSAALCGGWKALRYVNISNKKGLCGLRVGTRCAIEVTQFIQGRPDIHLIAEYPKKICFYGDCTNLPLPSFDNDSASSSSNNDADSSSSSGISSGSSAEASYSDDDADNY